MDYRIVDSMSTKIDLSFWQNAFKLNTAIPAIVDEFDANTQRISATPAIKAKYMSPEGEITYIDCPKIVNIPLAIQTGNGISITYPIKQGDICTLIFSQRSLDNFLLSGSISEPTEGPNPQFTMIRCMDMSDAMCFPGIITNNKAISNYSNDAIEIRNKDASTKISIAQNNLNFSQGGANIKLSGGNVEITGSSVKINGKDWATHMHGGVSSGGSNTGGVV